MAEASFICLLLWFSIFILSIAADISINCGSSSSQTDSTNRTWVGDTDYVSTGSSSKIESTKLVDYLTTLRYFPTGETSCYTNIPVNKGEKILVRTRFYYGNYDGEYDSPKFDVVYDGKHRDSITTETFSATYSEAIFVSESENISVCFVRTFLREHPFVSSLEVRSLDASMYSDLGSNEGYILRRRTSYGSKEFVRSPFDPYDRFWGPSGLVFPATVLTSAAVSINTAGSMNRPPEIVLRTSLSGKDMYFSDIKLPFKGLTFYLVMYFSEPISFSSGQKRSFKVYYDNQQVGSSLIVPPFGAVTQAVMRGVMMSTSPDLKLKATPDSNLPPLISALELYVISNADGQGGDGENGTKSTTGSSDESSASEGSKSGSNNGDRGSNKASQDENESSGGKSEEEKNNNLRLPLGITIPVVFLGAAVYCAWKYYFKPKRNHRSERAIRNNPNNNNNINVNVNMGNHSMGYPAMATGR